MKINVTVEGTRSVPDTENQIWTVRIVQPGVSLCGPLTGTFKVVAGAMPSEVYQGIATVSQQIATAMKQIERGHKFGPG